MKSADHRPQSATYRPRYWPHTDHFFRCNVFTIAICLTLTIASSTRSWSLVIEGVIFMYISMALLYSPFFSHSLPWLRRDSAPLTRKNERIHNFQKRFRKNTNKYVTTLCYMFNTLHLSRMGIPRVRSCPMDRWKKLFLSLIMETDGRMAYDSTCNTIIHM